MPRAFPPLPIDTVLQAEPVHLPGPAPWRTIGASRGGRPLYGLRLGRGPLRVSLIAGCHADEPVGPAMLHRLATVLAHRPIDDPLLRQATWSIVTDANPDGAARNAPWHARTVALAEGGRGYALGPYLRQAVREPPGDDVEFGFPRDEGDHQARPENRAIASFLRPGGPYHLHGSFHGMAFAAGPWFLLEAAWADRTRPMRDRLRDRVKAMGYDVHDVDRQGDKGFHRVDRGFTTRPDSVAMAAHFTALGDTEMAARFRPSSMEFVRSLGGDPLTLVSEMPLFLLPDACYRGENDIVHPQAAARLRALAHRTDDDEAIVREAEQLGVRPMPIADQMRLQLAYLQGALDAVAATVPDHGSTP